MFVSLVFRGWDGNPISSHHVLSSQIETHELAKRVLTLDMMVVHTLLTAELRVWNTLDAGTYHIQSDDLR